MPRAGEEVERIDLGHGIAFRFEDGGVAGKRIGVAGDIDDLGDTFVACEGIEKLGGTACARRVEDHGVGTVALPFSLSDGAKKRFSFPCVGADKIGVLDIVFRRILLGAFGRGCDDLDTDDLADVLCHREPDATHPRIEVEDAFIPLEIGKFRRLSVQKLCRVAVDLIERGGRDGKADAAQSVVKVGVAREVMVVIRANDVGLFGVYIEIHARNFGVLFTQESQKRRLCGKGGACDDESEHDVPRLRRAQIDMTQIALVRFFRIRGDPVLVAKVQNRSHDRGERRVLKRTIHRIAKAVGFGGVKACHA